MLGCWALMCPPHGLQQCSVRDPLDGRFRAVSGHEAARAKPAASGSFSYLFYGFWDWRFLSLLWISTIVDFVVGKRMGTSDDPVVRKRLLMTSMGVNLGILGFFKYFGFFAESAGELLAGLGLEADFATLRIVLPVGISFYTFQTMSYTIDIYRREIEPSNNLLGFAVFVAFFPQLVAGPIERAKHLLPSSSPTGPGWRGANWAQACC